MQGCSIHHPETTSNAKEHDRYHNWQQMSHVFASGGDDDDEFCNIFFRRFPLQGWWSISEKNELFLQSISPPADPSLDLFLTSDPCTRPEPHQTYISPSVWDKTRHDTTRYNTDNWKQYRSDYNSRPSTALFLCSPRMMKSIHVPADGISYWYHNVIVCNANTIWFDMQYQCMNSYIYIM